jgi:hypothetical protein
MSSQYVSQHTKDRINYLSELWGVKKWEATGLAIDYIIKNIDKIKMSENKLEVRDD